MEKPLERIWYYDTEIGRVGIAENGKAITEITLLKKPGITRPLNLSLVGAGITRPLNPMEEEETLLSPVGAGITRPLNPVEEEETLLSPVGAGITRPLNPMEEEETPLSPVGASITRPLQEETQLLKAAAEQLTDYLAGNRQTFDLPLDPRGTEFQKAVWKALLDIPYGEIRSYKQVAEAIGNPKACRAVGMANNKNPILIVIPCHRVIGSDGSLVGYGGGIDLKEKLLKLEGFEVKKKD